MNQISGFVKHLATASGLQSNANYVYYVPVRQFFKTVHGTGVMVPYFVSAFYGARIYLHKIYSFHCNTPKTLYFVSIVRYK